MNSFLLRLRFFLGGITIEHVTTYVYVKAEKGAQRREILADTSQTEDLNIRRVSFVQNVHAGTVYKFRAGNDAVARRRARTQ